MISSRLANLFGRVAAFFERRATPAAPDPWMLRFWGGSEASSGVRVSEQTALGWTALFSGVRFLSETLASLPLQVYERLRPRGKKLRADLGLYRLLHDAPNPEQTSFEFRDLMQTHVVLWGNAYAHIIWNGVAEPIELWPLNPDRVAMQRDLNGKVVYRVMLPADDMAGPTGYVSLPAEDVLHIRGFTRWGLLGERIARICPEAIGLGLATEEFAARFFGQGANAAGVLEHPGELSKQAKERLAESFEQQTKGLWRAHRVAVLEEGMHWKQISIEPEKAQFLGVRTFQVAEASRILRIPPHILFELQRATFTNIEQQGIDLVVYTLLPWAVRWEQRLNTQLISTKMQRTLFTKLGLDGFLRGDTATRYASYAQGRLNGWLSVNDIRELEDMNPVANGDDYLEPVNMRPLGSAAVPPKQLGAGAGAAAGDPAGQSPDATGGAT